MLHKELHSKTLRGKQKGWSTSQHRDDKNSDGSSPDTYTTRRVPLFFEAEALAIF